MAPPRAGGGGRGGGGGAPPPPPPPPPPHPHTPLPPQLWVALGFEEPTLLEKAGAMWHAAKQSVGLEARPPLTFAERAQAAIGAMGEAVVGHHGEEAAHPGLMSRIKTALGGAAAAA